MKKLVSLVLIGSYFVASIGCKKEIVDAPQIPDQVLSASSEVNATASSTKFGALINGLDGDGKITVCNKLAVGYVRTQIELKTFDGKNSLYDQYQQNGFKVVLTVVNKNPDHGAVSFPTNMNDYTSSLKQVLNAYTPEIAVIENEPFNDNRYANNNKTIDDYYTELKNAITVCHNKGVKVADGGLKGERVCILVYRDYVAKGEQKKADDFANKCLSSKNLKLAQGNGSPDAEAKVDEMLDMINHYKHMDLDYVNLHWYEPFSDINKYPDQSAPGVLQDVADYLREATGHPVITNEFGQNNNSTDLVQSLVNCLGAAGFKYAIDFSGDGKSGAVALNKNLDLKPNGKTYRDQIAK